MAIGYPIQWIQDTPLDVTRVKSLVQESSMTRLPGTCITAQRSPPQTVHTGGLDKGVDMDGGWVSEETQGKITINRGADILVLL